MKNIMEINKFNIPLINYPNYSLVDNYIEHWKYIYLNNLIKKNIYINNIKFGITIDIYAE